MHVVCPQCHAVYEVPEAALAGHPRVRCARCGAEWTPEPPAPPPPAAASETAPAEAGEVGREAAEGLRSGRLLPPEPEETPPVRAPLGRPARPAPPPSGRAIWVAWGASLLIVLAGLAGFFEGETAVVRTFPPALRLYRLLGRPDPPSLQSPAFPPPPPAGPGADAGHGMEAAGGRAR